MIEWEKGGLDGWEIQVVYWKDGFVVEETARIYHPGHKATPVYLEKFDKEFGLVEKRIRNAKSGETIYVQDSHNPELIARVTFESDRAKILNKEWEDDDIVSIEKGKAFLMELMENLKKQAKIACLERKEFWEVEVE